MIKKPLVIMSMALLTMVLAATGPASAQSTPQESLLTIILSSTPNNTFTSGSMTFDGKAVVTISDDVSNENNNYGWYHYGSDMSRTMTVSAAGGYTVTRCRFYSNDSSAFDEETPFEVVLSDGKAYVNGNSIGEYGLKRIDVYGYATPKNRTLKGIPDGWAVEADGQSVAVTDGAATIADGARVRLIPPTAVKPTVERVTVKMPIPLTLEALTNGTIVVKNPKAGMQYSLNGGEKTAVTSDAIIVVTVGDKVAFYGNGITSYSGTMITAGTAQTKAYGNIMSLVDEENFDTATTISDKSAFLQIFCDNTMLTDASGLLLPATTLAERCYCGMFRRCTSLSAAPELPATTLVKFCYAGMFEGCTSLSTAPALPATTLAQYCYYYMFNNCSNLSSVTCLATSGINQDSFSTYRWLHGVSANGTLYRQGTTDWPTGDDYGLPAGWTLQSVE